MKSFPNKFKKLRNCEFITDAFFCSAYNQNTIRGTIKMLFDLGRKEKENGAGKEITIIKARCPQNHKCPSLRVCPTEALTQKGFSAPEVDHGKCISCGKCARYCPMGAIALR